MMMEQVKVQGGVKFKRLVSGKYLEMDEVLARGVRASPVAEALSEADTDYSNATVELIAYRSSCGPLADGFARPPLSWRACAATLLPRFLVCESDTQRTGQPQLLPHGRRLVDLTRVPGERRKSH